jgi:hypothetical protein
MSALTADYSDHATVGEGFVRPGHSVRLCAAMVRNLLTFVNWY